MCKTMVDPKQYGPVFVGMRCTGKSTITPLAAQILGLRWIDSDAIIEQSQGRTIPEIFERDGEQGFRMIEGQTLLHLLDQPGTVLSTGGGAILNAEVRAILCDRFTVWLHAPIEVLAKRIENSTRPSLTGSPAHEELADILGQREPLYRQVCRIIVNTESIPPNAAAQLIADSYRAMCGTSQAGEDSHGI